MSWEELAGYPKESFTESSGPAAIRQFLVLFENRLTLIDAIVGGFYPHFPHSRVIGFSLEPFGGGEIPPNTTVVDPLVNSADYTGKYTLVTATYGPDFTDKEWPQDMPRPDNIREGTELRYRIQGTGQFLSIPSQSVKWEDDATIPVPADINSVILIPITSIQLQWDFVDDPPLKRLDDFIGTISSDDEFLGSEKETLLFDRYEVEESFKASSSNAHTNRITINIAKRRIIGEVDANGDVVVGYGWNRDYRENPAGWAKLLLSDDEPRYKLKEFADMFE